MKCRQQLILLLLVTLVASPLCGQTVPPANYDESKVPHYTLPDPLLLGDGRRVTDAAAWREKRRPEVLRLFEQYVYGKSPGKPQGLSVETRSVDNGALNGTAIRKEVTIHFSPGGGPKIDVLIYLPKEAKAPVPLFLGLNFDGNQTINSDPGITPSDVRQLGRPQPGKPVVDARAKARGSSAKQWPVEKILARGYGLATAWYGDIELDKPDGWRTGVRKLYLKSGQAEPADDEWGALGAWAWGMSRIMDYLETDRDVDARRAPALPKGFSNVPVPVALIGHSRLGKAALWAGAQDERFALVISNESGCGGASLARRQFGETPARISTTFPHWFCKNYRKYAFHVGDLPVDQHMLLALVAPRPLYVATAEGDRWSDPHGQFLAAEAANPVYRLLGAGGLPASAMPAVEEPVAGTISFHIRRGKHDVTDYDWRQYLDCADRNFKAK
jgi:hypothetical protein